MRTRSKRRELGALRERLNYCTLCELCRSRTQAVIGTGIPSSKIFILGEAPGKAEDEIGKPFVGRSGQLLDQLLEEVGLSRDRNVFISNVVKCRPPENREPTAAEIFACSGYLDQLLEIIGPKIVLCLGRVAAQHMIDPDFKVTEQHGNVHYIDGRMVMGTFHPAAVLRNPSYGNLMRQDLKILRDIIYYDPESPLATLLEEE